MINDYCKIYVNSNDAKRDFIELVRSIIDGRIEGRATIRATTCVIDVEDNDDYDPNLDRDSTDGFLYYRYYFDIEPLARSDRSAYIETIASLLTGIRKAGMLAVPACDFEAQLPRP